jgi:hypothetical protein
MLEHSSYQSIYYKAFGSSAIDSSQHTDQHNTAAQKLSKNHMASTTYSNHTLIIQTFIHDPHTLDIESNNTKHYISLVTNRAVLLHEYITKCTHKFYTFTLGNLGITDTTMYSSIKTTGNKI